MIQLLQPLASLLVGLAMAGYGIAHAIRSFPGGDTFETLANGVPALSAVLLFLLGLLAIVAGIVLVIVGSRKLRARWHRFNQLAHHAAHRGGPSYDDEWDYW